MTPPNNQLDTPAPPAPRVHPIPPVAPVTAKRAAPAPAEEVPGTPIEKTRRQIRAPEWLQLVIIISLFAAAIFVALDERYLWSALLAIAAIAFGASFVLRRMVGDEYGRA